MPQHRGTRRTGGADVGSSGTIFRRVAAQVATPGDAKRLKELEEQNATLKRLLAEAELEKAALKELAEGNF